MPDLELLPEKRKKIEFGEEKRFKFNFSILFLLLALALYGGLFFYNKNLAGKIKNLDNKMLNLTKDRDKEKEGQILEVKGKLEQVGTILENHIFWSKAFGRIKELTLPSIQFQSFEGSSPESKIEFKGIAPNLTTLAIQTANFVNNDLIKDVFISQIKIVSSNEVEFFAKLIIDSKFLK